MKKQTVASLLLSAGLVAGLPNLAWARPDNNWYFAQSGTDVTPGNINPDTSCLQTQPCSASSFTPQLVAAVTQLPNGQEAQFNLGLAVYGHGSTSPFVLSGTQSIEGAEYAPIYGAIEATGNNLIKSINIINDNQVVLPNIGPNSYSLVVGLFVPDSSPGNPQVTVTDTIIKVSGGGNGSVGAAGAVIGKGVLNLNGSLSDIPATITTSTTPGTDNDSHYANGLWSYANNAQINTNNVSVTSPTGNAGGTNASLGNLGLIDGIVNMKGGTVIGRSQYLLRGAITTSDVDVSQYDGSVLGLPNGKILGISGNISMTKGSIKLTGDFIGASIYYPFYPGSSLKLNDVDVQIVIQSMFSSTYPPLGIIADSSGNSINITGGTFKITAQSGCSSAGSPDCPVYAFGNLIPWAGSIHNVTVKDANIIVAGNSSSAISNASGGAFSNSTCTVNNTEVGCATSKAKFSKQDLQKMKARWQKYQKHQKI